MDLRVRVQSVPRADDVDDDESIGESLVALVRDALGRGAAPGAAVIVRRDRFEIVALGPVVQAKVAPAWFLAGLSRTPIAGGDVEAVGVIGTFRLRRRIPNGPPDPGVPVAMVFLEWTDCRWWQWRALLGEAPIADGRNGAAPPLLLRPDTETVLRAIDGTAKPSGLGGWWSLGRRRDVRLRWNRPEPVVYH